MTNQESSAVMGAVAPVAEPVAAEGDWFTEKGGPIATEAHEPAEDEDHD